MGFVNKQDGQYNLHQWNWPEVAAGPARKRAFHIDTKENIATSGKSQQGSFLTKETSQELLRRANIRTKRTAPKPGVISKTYNGLKFCEANMAMYLNSLELDVFNPDNEFIHEKISNNNFTEEYLTSAYNFMLNNYNKKSFDPSSTTYTDANGNDFTHVVRTIQESKSSDQFPTLSEFIERNRLSGAKAAYIRALKKRGISVAR